MGDYLISLIRTAVPAAWGTLVLWLVAARLLPPDLATQAEAFAGPLTAVAIALFYGGARWLEAQTWFPGWLSRLLLGSAQAPKYRT